MEGRGAPSEWNFRRQRRAGLMKKGSQRLTVAGIWQSALREEHPAGWEGIKSKLIWGDFQFFPRVC